MQRELAVAIVDEIDSVLIDSATSPLLLSQYSDDADIEILIYLSARDTVSQFIPGEDYLVDRVFHRITITDSGKQKIFSAERIDTYAAGFAVLGTIYVEQALHAKEFLQKDVDYVVQDGKVLLVDEFTGRFYPDRQWRDGLHQAVEAKEGISVNRREPFHGANFAAAIFPTLPASFRHDGNRARQRTGVLEDIYQLQIVAIPPHKPCQRKMLPSRFLCRLRGTNTRQ